jgi:ABC-type polysaccharide/polyol phosphate transport system ATPase subunit
MSPSGASPPSPTGTLAAHGVWKRFRADGPRGHLRDHVGRLRRTRRASWRWALRDVSFSLEPGESLGVIGANGSGKSTLLRILTGVTYPYAGRVETVGRVGLLIDVRVGMHQELTGRENVYLAGVLMGLPRRMVAARFDEIVEFAEMEASIDRQVKFYSTGMCMRLGFGVAAFLEPDVLVVDEVLAVGDSTFQQRCLDRMRAVLANGTTLAFVSHDLAAVEAMCNKGLWLNDGVEAASGTVQEAVGAYRLWVEETAAVDQAMAGAMRLVKAAVAGEPGAASVRSQGPLTVSVVVESEEERFAALCLGISEGPASPTLFLKRQLHVGPGETHVICSIPSLPLPRGRFCLWVGAFDGDRDLLPWQPGARFDVTGGRADVPPHGIVRLAPVHVEATWDEVRP